MTGKASQTAHNSPAGQENNSNVISTVIQDQYRRQVYPLTDCTANYGSVCKELTGVERSLSCILREKSSFEVKRIEDSVCTILEAKIGSSSSCSSSAKVR